MSTACSSAYKLTINVHVHWCLKNVKLLNLIQFVRLTGKDYLGGRASPHFNFKVRQLSMKSHPSTARKSAHILSSFLNRLLEIKYAFFLPLFIRRIHQNISERACTTKVSWCNSKYDFAKYTHVAKRLGQVKPNWKWLWRGKNDASAMIPYAPKIRHSCFETKIAHFGGWGGGGGGGWGWWLN